MKEINIFLKKCELLERILSFALVDDTKYELRIA